MLPVPVTAPLSGTPISYDVERSLRFDCGYVEIGRFFWSSPVEDILTLTDDAFALNLALSPRPSEARLARLDGGSNGEPENLGRVVLIHPGCTFRLSVPTGQVRALQCALDRRKLEELLGGQTDLDDPRLRMRLRTAGPVVEMLLNRIYEELCEEKFASELAIDSYANALCVELARCLRTDGAEQPERRKGGLAPWRMRLLRERIHAEAPAPRISELADLCGLTVRQLSRAFKTETGKTLGRFIDEATIERACRLLTQTDRPIAEIATQLGYANSASFAYSFRRSMGILPSDLRRRRA